MKKQIRKAIAILMFALAFATLLSVTSAAASETALPYEPVKVYMNGEQVLRDRALLVDSTTYVSLRSFAELVDGGEVSWNANTRTAYIKDGARAVSARDGDLYINADGRYFYTVERIRIINDTMYVPIRPMAKAFGVNVGWDAKNRSVSLEPTGELPVSGSRFYNADDVYWLSRIISAEAKGEEFKGQIAVGNVVLNRVRSKLYPNTIYGVIFDRKGGTQFSPVSFGTIYAKPTESATIAAKICLEGYTLSDDILFFMNPRIATNNWISRNRPFEFSIGNHDFYS